MGTVVGCQLNLFDILFVFCGVFKPGCGLATGGGGGVVL